MTRRLMRSAMMALLLGAAAATEGLAQSATGTNWFAGEIEVTCDVVGVEGVQILTVYGLARNDRDALAAAVRNAALVILFRGVQTSVCTVPPMLRPGDMTAEADRYFTRMFAPNGTYLSYVSFPGDQVESRMRVGRQIKVGTTVAVATGRLRQDLEQAGVLSTLGGAFRRP
jgi:hypothetical protein